MQNLKSNYYIIVFSVNWFHLSFLGRLLILFLKTTYLFTLITIMTSSICSCQPFSLSPLMFLFPDTMVLPFVSQINLYLASFPQLYAAETFLTYRSDICSRQLRLLAESGSLTPRSSDYHLSQGKKWNCYVPLEVFQYNV